MGNALSAALLAEVPGILHIGSMRVPLFGVLAALGVVAALLLSQYTARFVRLHAPALWDAGMVAVIAAFAASRLVLVAAAPEVFSRAPWTVLLLPSLSPLAMTLTTLVTFAWLRFRRLDVLAVLDAWAPCVCALLAVLSLAHFVEGTDAGMPTRLPWGVVTPGDHVLGRVHPVELYALAAWLALAALSLRLLQRRSVAGRPAGCTLLLGGAASFLLDMLRQPVESVGPAWLDPVQYAALGAIVLGAALLLRRADAPRREEIPVLYARNELLKETR